MKFIHTSDWHIGQDFFRYSREEEHLFFFQQLRAIISQEKPDALIVSGDVFHTAMPSAAAQKVYTDSIVEIHEANPNMKIIVTAGNHDSYTRLESAEELWKLANVKVIGNAENHENYDSIEKKHIIPLKDGEGNTTAYFIAIPYIRESNYELFKEAQEIVRKQNKENAPVVLMGHLAVSGADIQGHDESSIGGMDYVEIDKMGNYYDYLALGHIHHPQFIRGRKNARYSGSPIQINFDEMYPHSVTIVEMGHHGEEISAKEVEIKNEYQFLTIPSEPKPFEEALKELATSEIPDKSYVCLNVRVKDFVPADAEAQIQNALKGRSCRFCKIKITKEEVKREKEQRILDTEEVKRMAPVDLANLYFKETLGEDLDEETIKMIQEITDEIKQEERR